MSPWLCYSLLCSAYVILCQAQKLWFYWINIEKLKRMEMCTLKYMDEDIFCRSHSYMEFMLVQGIKDNNRPNIVVVHVI